MQAPDVEVSIQEIVAQLTERGRVEWDLAVQKATNQRLTEKLVKAESMVGMLSEQMRQMGDKPPAPSDHVQGPSQESAV